MRFTPDCTSHPSHMELAHLSIIRSLWIFFCPHNVLHSLSNNVHWNNQVKCWGYNKYKDPAYTASDADVDVLAPKDVFLGGNFTPYKVISGYHHNCAISVEGTIRCWGDPDGGQLGMVENCSHCGRHRNMTVSPLLICIHRIWQ